MPHGKKKTPQQRLSEHKRFMKGVMLTAVVLLVGVLGSYFWNFNEGVSGDPAKWGTFGDFVGGVLNPFFALLALLALLYTIVLQVEELQEMRDVAKNQAFENMFFQMLRLHHQIVDGMKVEGVIESQHLGTGNPQHGRDTFVRFCELLDKQLDLLGYQFDDDATSAPIDRQSIEQAWSEFFAANYPALSHYFRNLYNILRFVDDSEDIDDKNRYTRILRAQLSAYELKLLFYNGLDPANESFHKLAVRYALFEQIRVVPFSGAPSLAIRDNHFQFYAEGAYGEWTPPNPQYSDTSFLADEKPDRVAE
jgi:hypothetical protein